MRTKLIRQLTELEIPHEQRQHQPSLQIREAPPKAAPRAQTKGHHRAGLGIVDLATAIAVPIASLEPALGPEVRDVARIPVAVGVLGAGRLAPRPVGDRDPRLQEPGALRHHVHLGAARDAVAQEHRVDRGLALRDGEGPRHAQALLQERVEVRHRRLRELRHRRLALLVGRGRVGGAQGGAQPLLRGLRVGEPFDHPCLCVRTYVSRSFGGFSSIEVAF